MSSLTAYGRKKRFTPTGEWLAYKGVHGDVKISPDNVPSRLKFEQDYDLWYLQFTLRDRCALYCGVLDIDLSGPLKLLVKEATRRRDVPELKRLLKDLLDLLVAELEDYPYRIYASGSKGIHVYMKRNDAFLFADSHQEFSAEQVNAFLSRLYSAELLDLIDKSPYPHNKGIRPFTCYHPDTKVEPFVVLSNGWDSDNDEDSFLHWLCESMITGDCYSESRRIQANLLQLPSAQTVPSPRVERLVPLGVRREIYKEINVSFDTWIKSEAGTAIQKIKSGKYVIFNLPGVGCWCPIAGRYHARGRSACWYFFDNQVVICECFHTGCSGSRFVVRPAVRNSMAFGFPIPEDRLKLIDNPSNDVYLPDDILRSELETNRFVAIQARMGSGKTTQAKQCFEHFGGSGLIIGTRRQQINAWESVFAPLGFKNYEKVKGSLYNEPRVLVCLNSLPRLLGPRDPDTGFAPLPEYDLILLDEANSLAEWLGGRLLDNAPLIFSILGVLLKKTAKRVLAMDGLPTEIMAEMFKQLHCFDRFQWLVYPSKAFRRWTFCNDTKYYTQCFLSAIQKGKKIFFVSNSKKAIFRFYDLALSEGKVPKERMLAIHGDMSQESRDLCGDPKSWAQYDLVYANGSLGPGASFDAVHFHMIFVFGNVKQGITVESLTQLANRVRKPIDNKVIAIVLKKKLDELDSESTLEKVKQRRARLIGTYSEGAYPAWADKPIPLDRVETLDDFPNPVQMNRSLMRDPSFTEADTRFRREGLPTAVQTNISVIPMGYSEETQEIQYKTCSGKFGIIFEPTPLSNLQSAVEHQLNSQSANSELFLRAMQKVVSDTGAGYKVVGSREVIDDKGKDLIIGLHSSFLKQIGKRNRDSLQLDHDLDYDKQQSDTLLVQPQSVMDPEFYKTIKLALYDSSCSFTTRALRLRTLARALDTSLEPEGFDIELIQQCRKDVARLFQTPPDHHNAVNGRSIDVSRIARATLNHKITTSEAFACMSCILELLGWTFNRGRIIGEPYNSAKFNSETQEYRQAWWSVVRAIYNGFSREGYAWQFKRKTLITEENVPTDSSAHSIVFSHLQKMLQFFGIPTLKEEKRYVLNKVKHTRLIISLNEPQYCLHLAMIGLDPQSMEQIGQTPALLRFRELYPQFEVKQ